MKTGPSLFGSNFIDTGLNQPEITPDHPFS
jgi:hypothetical protein